MALTDPYITGFFGLLFFQTAIWFIFLKEKSEVWKRIVASFAIILLGISYVLVADTLIMSLFMFASILIGGKYLFEALEGIIH